MTNKRRNVRDLITNSNCMVCANVTESLDTSLGLVLKLEGSGIILSKLTKASMTQI